jgi:hypothetical protein
MCEQVSTDENGSTLRCPSLTLAAFPCDGTDVACDLVPQTAFAALSAGNVPEGICVVEESTLSLPVDADGYWQTQN